MENTPNDSLLQMNLDYDGGNILRDTLRWSRFLSIVGFVCLALFLLVILLAGSTILMAISRLFPGLGDMEGLGTAIFVIAIVLIFAVLGYAVYMLYRFSTLTRKGIEQQDQAVFNKGIQSLKTYFLIGGILSILSLLSNISTLIRLF